MDRLPSGSTLYDGETESVSVGHMEDNIVVS